LFCSDIINAINVPNEIISDKTFGMSIGSTHLPLKISHPKKVNQCATPNTRPVYCQTIITHEFRILELLYELTFQINISNQEKDSRKILRVKAVIFIFYYLNTFKRILHLQWVIFLNNKLILHKCA